VRASGEIGCLARGTLDAEYRELGSLNCQVAHAPTWMSSVIR